MQGRSFSNMNTAAYYLQELHNRPHPERRMRVVFLVQNDFIWDKQSPVYDAFAADDDVEPIIVLLPTYTATDHTAGKRVGEYEERYWHFFHDRYQDVYDFTNVLDLRVFQPDYIFLALPYEDLRQMGGTHTTDLVKIAKLCYIAYGTQGTKFFIHWETMMQEFFSHMTFHFCDSPEEKAAMESAYSHTASAGLQHFEDLGYPSFVPYLEYRGEPHGTRRILWMPRWTTDPMVGGSHFLDYKDHFVDFAAKYGSSELKFAVRPHPFMFDNFIQRGDMTENEVASYKAMLDAYGIELDDGAYTPFEALSRADILLTDFSSLNMPFFLLDRPLVYCPNGVELTDDYNKMLEGSYVAEDWTQAEYYLEQLIRSEDPAADRRRMIVAEFREKHDGAAERIAARLKKDHADSLCPEHVYLPDVEKWIFDQKKALVSVIGGGNEELLQDFCAQEWYALYLALLPLRLHNENLVWGEEQILGKLQEMYESAEARERRSRLVLAMLLFADPLTLSVPVEIDLWPGTLYHDIQNVVRRHRLELGII